MQNDWRIYSCERKRIIELYGNEKLKPIDLIYYAIAYFEEFLMFTQLKLKCYECYLIIFPQEWGMHARANSYLGFP
jgi:hypothetical protein